MFDTEFESIRTLGGRLKAELTSLHLGNDVDKDAVSHIDQAISLVETAIATREAAAPGNQKDGGPKLDGSRGVVGDETEDEEVEEDEVDETGKATGKKKTVVKKVPKKK